MIGSTSSQRDLAGYMTSDLESNSEFGAPLGRGPRAWRGSKALVLSAALGSVALVGVLSRTTRLQRADVEATTDLQLMSILDGASLMSSAFSKLHELNKMKEEKVKKANEEYKEGLLAQLREFKSKLNIKLHHGNLTQEAQKEKEREIVHDLEKYKAVLLKKFGESGVEGGHVLPRVNLTDGNACAEDEEQLGQLCYKKCSLLTNSKLPYRLSAYQCCKTKACEMYEVSITSPLKVCGGYSISGDSMGGGCPHPLGSCLANEEFSHGACYKKCSLLTDGIYPYRTAGFACCKYPSMLLCLDLASYNASTALMVGGGADDGRNWTPSVAHGPLRQAAEEP